jgi:hypothetical protein
MLSRIKALFSLNSLWLILTGCPIYDPPNPGPLTIYNCSDRAIYVYHSYNGKLEKEPRLELFEEKQEEFMFEKMGCEKLLKSPEYRVNAYEEEIMPFVIGREEYNRDSVFFFFITEETMREFSWKKIVDEQLYARRISLALEDFNDLHRVVTFTRAE